MEYFPLKLMSFKHALAAKAVVGDLSSSHPEPHLIFRVVRLDSGSFEPRSGDLRILGVLL